MDTMNPTIGETKIHANAPPTVPAMVPPQVGGYEIQEELGRGGMGVVYRARQVALDRIVAIKMILTGSAASTEDLRRFRSEAELIARLDHPNLIAIHEVGEWRGNDLAPPLPFLVMEYMGGGSLEKQAGTPMPPREAATLIRTLAQALHVVHQRGIVHRDLKPGNILLTTDGTPKITDFGLAKRLENQSGLTHTGAVLGTPAYMAPEQAAGRNAEVGPPADIHALGAILYQLLVGQPPYSGATAWQTMERVLNSAPASLRRQRHDVPRDLEVICLKCLEKIPARRYLDARALADDLGRFLDGLPVEARPTPTWERGWKWARRQPAVASLLSVCLLSIVLLVAGGLVYQGRLRQALLETQASQEESRRRLELLSVSQGVRALDEGSAASALVWFVAALRLDAGHPEFEPMHRVRIATVLRSLPPLRQIAFFNGSARVAQFAPNNRRILGGGDGGRAQVWDFLDHKPVGPELKYPAKVLQGVFGQNSSRFALGLSSGRIVLNDLRGGPEKTLTGHTGAIRRLALTDTQYFSASEDGTARLWPITGDDPGRIVARLDQALVAADVTGDGALAVTAAADHTVRIWQTRDGTPTCAPLPHPDRVLDVRFDRAGVLIATACADGGVRLWNLEGRSTLAPLRHRATVQCVRFSPDGSRLLSASDDHTAQVWDVRTGEKVLPPLVHQSGVNQATFSPDGSMIATASDDNTARVWDASTGDPLVPRLRHTGSVEFARFSGDNRLVATASHDFTIRVWDLAPRPSLNPVPEPPQTSASRSGPGRWFSPDGEFVLTAENDHSARVRNARTGAPLTPLLPHGSTVLYAAFLPGDDKVITCSDDNIARIWSIRTGKMLCRPLIHAGAVRYARFSQDGAMVLTAAADDTVRVWDTGRGELLSPSWRIQKAVRTSAFAPDNDRVSVYLVSGKVHTWDLRPDDRPIDDLERTAHIYAGRYIDLHHGLIPMSISRLEELWHQRTGQRRP